MGKALENIAAGFRTGALALALATGTISGTSAENNVPQGIEVSVSNNPVVTELSPIYSPFVDYEGEQILVPRTIYIKPNMKEIKSWILNHGRGEFHLTAKFMSDDRQEVSPTYLIGSREKGSRFYGATLVGKKSDYAAPGSNPFIPEHPKVLFDNLSFSDVLGSINPFGIFTGNLINVQSLMSKLSVELNFSYYGHNVFAHAVPEKGNHADKNGYYESKTDYFTIDGGKKIWFPSN